MPRIPLLRVLAPFALGIAGEDALAWQPLAPAALVLLGAVLCWSGRPVRGELLLGLGLGALTLALRLHAPVPSVGAGPVVLSFLAPPRVSGPSCQVEVFVHGAAPGRALLRVPAERCAFRPGQRALARISLGPLRPATNPGGSDPQMRWRRRGVRAGALLEGGRLVPVAPEGAGVAAAVAALRARIAVELDPPDQPGRAGPLLRALATGDRSRISPGLRDAFARSGTAHLLAVSGLHVGWVFAMTQIGVGWLLRRASAVALLRHARSLALLAGVAAGTSYAALTGFGVPALRASAMALAGAVALLSGRPGAGANALVGAALVVLAIDPAALFEPAFGLSFAAVAGILIWRPPPGRLSALLHCTLAAGLATAPFLAALGAPLPAGSLLANALAIPLFGALLVPAALLAGVTLAAAPGLAPLLGPPLSVLGELSIRLVESLSSPDLLRGDPHALPRTLVLAAAGFGLRLALRAGRRRGALLALLVLAAALLVRLPAPAAEDPFLLALDVGHGDAIVVRAGPRTWLIDAGASFAGFDAGRQVVLPALRAEGVARLDVLVITHSDRDHVGGAAAVVDAMPVGELWLGRATWRHPAVLPLRRAAARHGVPLRVIAAGRRYRDSSLAATVLWPPPQQAGAKPNATSVVLRLALGSGCALLPGDAPAAVERLLARELEPCAFLKLAHHGSRSSSDPLWLARLAPELALSSSGRRPRSPLPHAVVRARLARDSVSLYETAHTGALRLRFVDGLAVAEPFRVRSWRRAAEPGLHSPDGEAASGS